MGGVIMKEETLDKKSSIIKEVLEYFHLLEGKIESSVLHKIAAGTFFSKKLPTESLRN